jgi:hypothetical protein
LGLQSAVAPDLSSETVRVGPLQPPQEELRLRLLRFASLLLTN